jgi:Ca2+-binding RTX toxin-like protein
MSGKLFRAKRTVLRAAVAVVERVEGRLLLTTVCSGPDFTGLLEVFGDSAANTIVVSYNSGTSSVTVADGGSSPLGCANIQNVVSVKVYGGSSTSHTATGTGADTITIHSSMPSTIPTTLLGQDGADSIYGGAGVDSIHGGTGDNYLSGGGWNDTLQASDGNDSLYGGEGDDFLFGDGGNNLLIGDGGNDILFSGAFIFGASSGDSLYGGSGHDTLTGSAYADLIDGGAGNDSMIGYDGN